ncbi:hypothetical protein SDC9_115280 [bioreactor metagenome]|uniref:Uncharacterized protein n=1 Tax=bioreactor metagenome TaxID=1076179 RepID=A0A645BTE8_9ZZZZ
MAGSVDDVDEQRGAVVFHDVADCGVLGEDRDAFFALKIHRVHYPLLDIGALPEGPGLPQHGIHKGGLSVIDVGDDGDIAQI